MPDQSTDGSDFTLTDLHVGDLVQLHWTGDRRVPNRESGCWATIDEVRPGTAMVHVHGYGTTRYITIDHVNRVDRPDGRKTYGKIATRVQAQAGTRLARMAS